MSKNKTTLAIVVLVIFAIVAVFIISRNPNTAIAPIVKTNNQASSTTRSTGKTYNLAEVAAHGSGVSCWSVVNGGVYDLTAWISQHPGGSKAILAMCGRDASDDFNGKHGGQARPASELAGFKIGVLK